MPLQYLSVLHLEDNHLDSLLVQRHLEQAGFRTDIERVETREAFSAALDTPIDVIIADHELPGIDSFEALEMVRARNIEVPFIIVSGALTEEAAVGTLKRGAADFVLKDRMARLGPAVMQALREQELLGAARRERQERRRSERLAESVLSSLPQQIAVIDFRGMITRTNEAWRQLSQQDGVGLVGGAQAGSDYLTACRTQAERGADAAAELVSGIQEVLNGERATYQVEYAMGAEKGKQWFALTVAPLWDNTGAVIVHEETTQRHLHQQVVEEKERGRRALFESSLDPILLINDDGHCVDVNPATSLLLGYSRDELLSLNAWELAAPEDHEQTHGNWDLFLENGRLDGELSLFRNDGQKVIVEFHATASILPGLHLVIFHDVTERKRFEDELIAARDRAEESTRLKTAFLANMSHELRTPLTSIIGFAEVLGAELNGEKAFFAGQIRESGSRLMDTLTSLLEMSRIEAGDNYSVEVEPIDLHAVATTAVAELQSPARQKGIDLKIEAPDQPIKLKADRSALERVIHQLTSNAIKFTSEGSVTISMGPVDDIVQLRVTDTGVGIAEEFVPELFTGFRQESEGNTREFEGSGIGLAVCRFLVRLMGGEIRVHSIKGEGSTFTICLPANPLEPSPRLDMEYRARSNRPRGVVEG